MREKRKERSKRKETRKTIEKENDEADRQTKRKIDNNNPREPHSVLFLINSVENVTLMAFSLKKKNETVFHE
jgi:hypothetical protein